MRPRLFFCPALGGPAWAGRLISPSTPDFKILIRYQNLEIWRKGKWQGEINTILIMKNYIQALKFRQKFSVYFEKGDRKEEYQEVDLKQERFVYDPETKTAHFIPGREDSYERLVEDEKRQFSNEDPTPEEHLMRSIENELLRQAVALLKEDERQLILLRFWQECSQSQVADLLGLSQQAVSYRERNILGKIKKFLKK